MKTLHELKCYLVKENFNMNSIYINEPNVAEGLSLEGYDNTWTLSFVERRKESIQKEFTNEKDLVKYALAKLRGNKWYKSKIIAFVHTEKEIKDRKSTRLNSSHLHDALPICIYINEPNVAEGLSLEGYDNTWTLSFVERRKKSIQKEFTNEKDLVKYALAKLRGNKWYKSKIIAFVHTEKEI